MPIQRSSPLIAKFPSPISEAISENDHFVKRLFDGSDASDCAAPDTVMKTEPSYPSPPQWAYRASNATDPSKSVAYFDVVHPVLIKLEDLARYPATDDNFIGHHCYSNDPLLRYESPDNVLGEALSGSVYCTAYECFITDPSRQLFLPIIQWIDTLL